MPKAGVPFRRVPVDQLPETILSGPTRMGKLVMPPGMIMEGALPNYFTINGKAYPSTDTLQMKVGQTVKLRFIGTNNNFVYPMHVHGGPFEVIARDDETLKPSARFLVDTVNVGPGQRYDVIWTGRNAGTWLVYCHIPHHTVNDNVEEQSGGGLMMKIVVRG